jgi:hypothetical protein
LAAFTSYHPVDANFPSPHQPLDLLTITLLLASTMLPDANAEHKRKNHNAAKSLT